MSTRPESDIAKTVNQLVFGMPLWRSPGVVRWSISFSN